MQDLVAIFATTGDEQANIKARGAVINTVEKTVADFNKVGGEARGGGGMLCWTNVP